MGKQIQHFFEAAGFKLICTIFHSLPLKKASAFGGWLARIAGPWLPLNRTAHLNISTIFPHLSREQRQQMIRKMWTHWGRVVAEYSHIPELRENRTHIRVHGVEILEDLKKDGKPAILFSGHLGNFQMATLAAAQHGLPLVQFYRHANNLSVDRDMRKFQKQASEKVLTRHEHGIRGLMKELKAGAHVFILVDQKFLSGLSIPFLGKPAPTAPAVAKLCQHFDCPLVPVRVQRSASSPLEFDVTFYPPLNVHRAARAVMTAVNECLGAWIRECPEQWFWIHRRWPFSSREESHAKKD